MNGRSLIKVAIWVQIILGGIGLILGTADTQRLATHIFWMTAGVAWFVMYPKGIEEEPPKRLE
jgi:hypothetical protein